MSHREEASTALDDLRAALSAYPAGSLVSADVLREPLSGLGITSERLGALFQMAARAGWLERTGRVTNSVSESRKGGLVREYRVTGNSNPLRHEPDCRHCRHVRQIASDYRLARQAQEVGREAVTRGYAAENAEYGRLITFRQWLTDTVREEAG